MSALRASFLTFYLIPDLTVGAISCRRFAAEEGLFKKRDTSESVSR